MRCTTFLYYNGNYNRKNLWKPKNFICGTKTHSYELIFHPHIEESQTKSLFYKKKKSIWSQKYLKRNLDLWFLLLQWTSIVAAEILNLKFVKKVLDQIILFYKTDYLNLVFTYMWVKYELIQMSFTATNEIFRF